MTLPTGDSRRVLRDIQSPSRLLTILTDHLALDQHERQHVFDGDKHLSLTSEDAQQSLMAATGLHHLRKHHPTAATTAPASTTAAILIFASALLILFP